MEALKGLIDKLRNIQNECNKNFGVPDMFSSSKFFELLIANELNHIVIGGFSGFRDAKDCEGNQYEYKHYKESSSNHTWTFNDFSDATIENLNSIKAVVFAHIDDSGKIPFMDWCYIVSGKIVSDFLKRATMKIKNTRKMINVSPNQIEKNMSIKKIFFKPNKNGKYTLLIKNR